MKVTGGQKDRNFLGNIQNFKWTLSKEEVKWKIEKGNKTFRPLCVS